MPGLVDTNLLVYRFDERFPDKQRAATALLREGTRDRSLKLPYQALLEFVAATTRRRGSALPLLTPEEARREAEELLRQFDVLYPTEPVFRLALRGAAAYGLSWFDASMWAYAEHYGCATLWSEDFEHRRLYGSVRAKNPFQFDPDPGAAPAS